MTFFVIQDQWVIDSNATDDVRPGHSSAQPASQMSSPLPCSGACAESLCFWKSLQMLLSSPRTQKKCLGPGKPTANAFSVLHQASNSVEPLTESAVRTSCRVILSHTSQRCLFPWVFGVPTPDLGVTILFGSIPASM